MRATGIGSGAASAVCHKHLECASSGLTSWPPTMRTKDCFLPSAMTLLSMVAGMDVNVGITQRFGLVHGQFVTVPANGTLTPVQGLKPRRGRFHTLFARSGMLLS